MEFCVRRGIIRLVFYCTTSVTCLLHHLQHASFISKYIESAACSSRVQFISRPRLVWSWLVSVTFFSRATPKKLPIPARGPGKKIRTKKDEIQRLVRAFSKGFALRFRILIRERAWTQLGGLCHVLFSWSGTVSNWSAPVACGNMLNLVFPASGQFKSVVYFGPFFLIIYRSFSVVYLVPGVRFCVLSLAGLFFFAMAFSLCSTSFLCSIPGTWHDLCHLRFSPRWLP